MKLYPGTSVAGIRRRGAFTLIELLAVMAIILVLAGLIINIAGSAQYNSAKARATTEISAMATALESYKSDNGAYPPDPYTPTDNSNPSTLLNPQTDFDPTNTKYLNNSEYLYQVLSGFTVTVTGSGATPTPTPSGSGTPALAKAYMAFRPDQLHMAAGSTDTTLSVRSATNYIIDPFGFSYGYSTINSAMTTYNNAQAASGSTTATTSGYGYNPTFDLWSTGGYAPGGKATPSNTPSGSSTPAAYSSIWIKNW